MSATMFSELHDEVMSGQCLETLPEDRERRWWSPQELCGSKTDRLHKRFSYERNTDKPVKCSETRKQLITI